ncbi:hypothetical protein K8S19_00900, partial [bacterium]|nr:hypothetical protein [bacterium]
GAIVGYQADKYYFQSRYDGVAQSMGLESPIEFSQEAESWLLDTTRGGETAAAWHATARQKSGVSAADMTNLVSQYLAEADQALNRQADKSLAAVRQALKQELEKGAEPNLATMMRIIATVEGVEAESLAGLLRELAGESVALDASVRKLVANGVISRFIAGETQVSANAAVRGIEDTAIALGQEVYMMAMPETNKAQLAAVRRALIDLRGQPGVNGLRDRLLMVEKALAAVAAVTAGKMGQLDATIGQQVKAEVARLAKTDADGMLTIGEDLSRNIHGVKTGHVETTQLEGIDMANPMVFEVSAPVDQKLSATDVSQAKLPKQVRARQYDGTIDTLIQVPTAKTSIVTGLMQLIPSRRMHTLVMRSNPMGYLRSILNSLGVESSTMAQMLGQGSSPVVQAYLKYAATPASRKAERDFVKTMLRALKAQGMAVQTDAAAMDFENSVAAFSELVQSMKALSPGLVTGNWTQQTASRSLAGKTIHIPGVLLQIGGKGALGAYFDILNELPAKINENVLENQRRRLFRSTSVAA